MAHTSRRPIIVETKNVKIGQVISEEIQITDAMVRAFADLSGDHNPVHLDDAFAAQTRFKQRIAHGMISGALISRLLANEFPGGIYLSQNIKFIAPVYINDVIQFQLKLTNIRAEKNILSIETNAYRKSNNEQVAKGEAIVMYPAPL